MEEALRGVHRVRLRTALVACAAAIALAFGPYMPGLMQGRLPHIGDYASSTLRFNYFEFGAIRRGLGGSIAYLLGPDWPTAFGMFHILTLLAVAAVFSSVFGRIRGSTPTLIAFGIVLADVIVFWRIDAGRTDSVVAVLIALAAVAVGRGYLVPAALCLAIGLFINELSFIYGLPLITALLVNLWSATRPQLRAVALAAAVLTLAIAGYVGLRWLPQSPTDHIVSTVRASMPKVHATDAALYWGLLGSRVVSVGRCINNLEPNYVIHLLVAIGILGLSTFALRGLEWRAWLLTVWTGVIPFAFLWTFASDMSRWMAMSLCSVWLAQALTPAGVQQPRRLSFGWLQVTCAALVFVLHYPHTTWSKLPMLTPSPLIDSITFRTGISKFRASDQTLELCDPDWKSVLGEPESPPRP